MTPFMTRLWNGFRMFDFKRKVRKEIFINIENNFGTQRRFTQEMKIENKLMKTKFQVLCLMQE